MVGKCGEEGLWVNVFLMMLLYVSDTTRYPLNLNIIQMNAKYMQFYIEITTFERFYMGNIKFQTNVIMYTESSSISVSYLFCIYVEF